MLYFLDKMKKEYYPKRKIKIEDILFWMLILGIIAVALWLLHGSPTEIGALISIAVFVAASEILIWKNLFSIDKNFSLAVSHLDKKNEISFIKLKNDMDNMLSKINNRFDSIDGKLKLLK